MRPRDTEQRQISEFEERVVQIKRVSKKTGGGSKIGFTALVIVGDKKGKIGVGLGKATDVSSAVQKGISLAKRSVKEIKINNETIAHEITHKEGAALVKIKPAPKGSGIIAGGAIRHVAELVGIKDISVKMLGSNNKIENIRCVIGALSLLKGQDAIK